MLSKCDIESAFSDFLGVRYADYLKNKTIGGANGQKGVRYEDYFICSQIVEWVRRAIDGQFPAKCLKLESQHKGLVDDLVLHDDELNVRSHYQCKNAIRVVWGQGFKSISDDFLKQKEFNDKYFSFSTTTHLVLSNKEILPSLRESTPNAIQDFTTVIYFPETKSVNKLILDSDEFRKTLTSICVSGDIDKLETLFQAILGVWVDSSSEDQVTLELIINKVRRLSPNFLYDPSNNHSLIPMGVRKILDSVPDFTYNVNAGYFEWAFRGGQFSGMSMHSIDSKDFEAFCIRIEEKRPNGFGELLGLLEV